MARNKEIDRFYSNFVRDLLLLLDESKSHYDEKLKKINIVDDKYTSDKIFKGEVHLKIANMKEEDLLRFRLLKQEQQELYRGIWLALNSNFIYCFALFETFQSGVVKAAYKKNGKSKEKYILRFREFAKDIQKKEGTDRYINMLIDNKAMIEHYDDLPNPMQTCMFMFDIDTKNIEKYEEYDFKFVEAKERRNLLIHRGVYADKRYFDSVKQRFSNRKKKVDEFLEETISTFSTGSKQEQEQRKTNLSVSKFYMARTVSTLLYTASLIYFNNCKITKKEINNGEGSILPNNIMHDVMSKFDSSPFLPIAVMDIVNAYKVTLGKESWKNIPDYDKMNYLLTKDYFLSLAERYSKNKENKEQKEKKDKFIAGIINLLSDEHKLKGRLLESSLNNDVDQLISCIKKLDMSKHEIKTWFVFRKFHIDKKFQEFVNTLKE